MELTSSTRTSITLTQDAAVAVETISLEQGIQSKEYPLEKISNDDVREPRFYHSQPHSIHVGDNTSNPNLVTFDGPNDPIDPQNWSNGYKWWITIYCCIMTFDVYVLIYLLNNHRLRNLMLEHLPRRHHRL